MNNAKPRIKVGQTFRLTVVTDPSSQKILWRSVDKSIATVDTNGLVKGVDLGRTLIIGSVKGSYKKVYVMVSVFDNR